MIGNHEQRSKSVIDALNRSFANENDKTNRSLANGFLVTKDTHPSDINSDGLVLLESDGLNNNIQRSEHGNR